RGPRTHPEVILDLHERRDRGAGVEVAKVTLIDSHPQFKIFSEHAFSRQVPGPRPARGCGAGDPGPCFRGAELNKNIVVFEVEGGSDKYFDGHRRDTMPIVEAIRAKGWGADVVYYRPEWADALFEHVSANYGGYISRVNPGNIPGGEKGYFDLLTRLSDEAGLVGMSTPEEMMAYGAKDALVKLNDTDLVPTDTAAYYDVESFHETFPKSLSYGERVLKQNRGSTGSGIWRVQLEDTELAASVEPGTALPLDTPLKCTEAVDNHTEIRELGEFMEFCDRYII